jgi:hypothetical protein
MCICIDKNEMNVHVCGTTQTQESHYLLVFGCRGFSRVYRFHPAYLTR